MTMFEGNNLLEVADRLGASFITRDERLYAGSWWNVTPITANYTALLSDVIIPVDTTSGNVTVTLPKLADSAYKIYVVKKTSSDANTVTIDADGTETIDGATTKTITRRYETLTIVSNGTGDWHAFEAYSPSAVLAPTAGTTGTLAKFTSGTTIGDSIISESGTTATVTGDLAFSGNARRISAESASATVSNRLHVVPSNANTNGYFGVVASGTALQSRIQVHGGSNVDSAVFGALLATSGNGIFLNASRSDAALTYPRLSFQTGGATRLTFTKDGGASFNATDLTLLADAAGNVSAGGSIAATSSFLAASAAAPASPADGQFWNDSTQKAIIGQLAGVKQTLAGVIFTQTADKTVTNTTTETTLMGTGVGTLTLPANFWTAGKTIRIRQWGYYTQPAATAITRTVKIKLGSVTLISKAVAIGASAASNDGYQILYEITCRTTGATGTVYGQGSANISAGSYLTNTATTTVDTTAAAAIDITFTWGSASSTVSITSTNMTVEVLN